MIRGVVGDPGLQVSPAQQRVDLVLRLLARARRGGLPREGDVRRGCAVFQEGFAGCNSVVDRCRIRVLGGEPAIGDDLGACRRPICEARSAARKVSPQYAHAAHGSTGQDGEVRFRQLWSRRAPAGHSATNPPLTPTNRRRVESARRRGGGHLARGVLQQGAAPGVVRRLAARPAASARPRRLATAPVIAVAQGRRHGSHLLETCASERARAGARRGHAAHRSSDHAARTRSRWTALTATDPLECDSWMWSSRAVQSSRVTSNRSLTGRGVVGT